MPRNKTFTKELNYVFDTALYLFWQQLSNKNGEGNMFITYFY